MTNLPQQYVTPGDILAASQQGFEDFRPEDLQAPQIKIMQKMSDAVSQDVWKAGDIVTDNQQKLGDKTSRFDIIPLTYYKKWLVTVHPGGAPKGKFVGIHQMDSGLNDYNKPFPEKTGFDQPIQFVDQGVPHRRTKIVELFCLLKSDLETAPVPHTIWFRGGAYNRAGRGIMSHFMFQKVNKKTPHYSVLSLGCHLRKNDQGDWYEFDVKPVGSVDKAHHEIIDSWYHLIGSKKVVAKVDLGETEGDDVP